MRTHYDVLNLGKNCSAKEIKDSFLKLSKIYHPDRNKQADAHLKFVEVNEAYSVLGKVESRHRYDESLCAKPKMEFRNYGYSAPSYMRPYEYYAAKYAKERGYHPGAPYFTRSKLQLFCFCCVLIMIGTGIQLKALCNRRYYQSQKIALSLKEAKDRNMVINKEFFKQLRETSK